MSADLDAFARAWIEAWNGHELETILGHYAEDVVFRSPRILGFTQGRTDQLNGREELRPYFARGLAARPNLRFDLRDVFRDAGGVALIYEAENGGVACETMTLDEAGRVSQARVFYRSLEGLT